MGAEKNIKTKIKLTRKMMTTNWRRWR